jgi:hypothetical protein
MRTYKDATVRRGDAKHDTQQADQSSRPLNPYHSPSTACSEFVRSRRLCQATLQPHVKPTVFTARPSSSRSVTKTVSGAFPTLPAFSKPTERMSEKRCTQGLLGTSSASALPRLRSAINHATPFRTTAPMPRKESPYLRGLQPPRSGSVHIVAHHQAKRAYLRL